jgi:hypothetical protein
MAIMTNDDDVDVYSRVAGGISGGVTARGGNELKPATGGASGSKVTTKHL